MISKKKDNKSQLLPPLKHNKTDIEWSKRHCFVILKGKTMRMSSDFKLFQRYCYQSLTRVDHIIDILEQLLTTYNIEMAIVDGQYLVALAMRDDDPTNDELFEALTNKLELKLKIYTIANASLRREVKAINTIQSAVRRWLYRMKRYKKQVRTNSIITIQSCIRSYLSRKSMRGRPPLVPVYYQDHWASNQTKLTSPTISSVPTMVSHTSETSHPTISSSALPLTNHLIILYIPPPVTITSDPSLSILHLLNDPNITLIFIYPRPLSTSLTQHIHDYLINTLQIYDCSNRLHMVVPATWERFRYYESFRSGSGVETRKYSVDMLLWCDASTLKRIDNLLHSYTNNNTNSSDSNNSITYTQCIIPANPSCTCKRVADFLKMPLLAGHPDITTKLSRNYDLNRAIFTAVKCRLQPKILVDIVTVDDLCVALVPLILNHLDTAVLSLSLSYTAAGTGAPTRSVGSYEFYFQSTDLSVYNTLIKQRNLAATSSPVNTANSSSSGVAGRDQWGSRASQVKYGQKLLIALKEELCGILHPLYSEESGHNSDLSTLLSSGHSMACAIEGGVSKKLGLVQGYCYIHPTGKALFIGGADVLSATMIGKQYSTGSLEASGRFGYSFPQSKTPSRALEGACLCVCQHLYATYDVIGYVTVQYMAWWDEEARLPRLSGVDISFGIHDMVPIIEAYTQRPHSLSSLTTPTTSNNADTTSSTNSISAELTKQIIYIPNIHEPGLLTIRREAFLQGCKNKGLTYDTTKQTGCIFTSPSGFCGDIISYTSITTGSRSAALALSQRAADYLASLAENTGLGRKSSTTGGKASKVVYDTTGNSISNNTSGDNSDGNKQRGIDVNNIHSLQLSIILRKIIKNEEKLELIKGS